MKVPLCCIPNCCDLKHDIYNIKKVDQRILKELDCLSFIKFIDICYKLSTSFFKSNANKNISLLYFKENIDESEEVIPQIEKKEE